MSKAVMLSIRPKWCEKIAGGEKTIEVRKTRPKLDTPFKCYIYCTLPKYPHEDFIATNYSRPQFYGGGKVIGEFTCDRIIDAWWDYVPDAITREVAGGNLEALDGTGMTDEELFSYVGDSMRGHCYGWHITDLRIYDAPKCLFEFWAERLCRREPSVFGCGECCDCDKRAPQSWCYVEEVVHDE